jgi:hypothetical protein
VSELAERVTAVSEEAATARERVDPGTAADPGAALDAARDGLWPVLRVYIDARRTGVRLEPDEQAALDAAVDDWLAVYAAHHGYRVDPSVPVREAAEAFLDTHNIRDTAAVLTGVPERRGQT